MADSTYYENINFLGKAITVASHFMLDGDTAHISKTIINGSQSTNPDTASVVSMWSGEDTTSVMMGFTITGGSGTYQVVDGYKDYYGGGILIEKSGGKILHNIIEENHVVVASNERMVFGGGIGGDVFENHTLIVRNNKIWRNSVDGDWVYGAGICLTGGRIIIEDNTITHNTMIGRGADAGGGIFWGSYGLKGVIEDVIIRNNIIDSNKGAIAKDWVGGGGIYTGLTFSTPIQIYNNVISNNSVGGCGGGIFNWASSMKLMNNTIINNSSGMGGNTFEMGGGGEVIFLNNIMGSDIENNQSDYLIHEEAKLILWVYNNLLRHPISTGNTITSRGNIYAEPSFEAGSNELEEYSPGIGQGLESVEIQGERYSAPGRDIYGNIRPHAIDSLVDIGAVESAYAGYVHIPDTAFLYALIEEGVDTNEDSLISYAEAEALTHLDVSGEPERSGDITNMTGIEAFVNLTLLNCGHNSLAYLNVTSNAYLSNLNCSNNNIVGIDVINNIALVYLQIAVNDLTSLDISNNTLLDTLYIGRNEELMEVCVWMLPFPPEYMVFDKSASGKVWFDTICDGNKPVGIEEHSTTGFLVYPNPTNSLLTIETDTPDHYSIEIASLNGQLIYSITMEGTSHQIDLSSFQKGVYLLTIRSADFLATRKIIKL